MPIKQQELRYHNFQYCMFLILDFFCHIIPAGAELWRFALSWFFGSHSSWNSCVSLIASKFPGMFIIIINKTIIFFSFLIKNDTFLCLII